MVNSHQCQQTKSWRNTSDCRYVQNVRESECHISARRTMSQGVMPSDVHAGTELPGRRADNRSQLCSGALTLYENAHVPTAEVDVIGNLTPVNSRVIPLEGTQEEQGAVQNLHPLWHVTVQPMRHEACEHPEMDINKQSILLCNNVYLAFLNRFK